MNDVAPAQVPGDEAEATDAGATHSPYILRANAALSYSNRKCFSAAAQWHRSNPSRGSSDAGAAAAEDSAAGALPRALHLASSSQPSFVSQHL